MEFNLGQIVCIFCDSKNLQYCEMDTKLEKQQIDDWELENEITDYTKDSFNASTSQITLLVNCKDCKQWFKIEAQSKTIGTSNLPISLPASNFGMPLLECDPLTQEPKSLFVGHVRLPILDFSIIRLSRQPYSGFGAFYPYPTGEFHLKCGLEIEGKRRYWVNRRNKEIRSFRCILSKDSSPDIVIGKIVKDFDLDCYTLHYKWIDEDGIDLQLYLFNINKDIKEKQQKFFELSMDKIFDEFLKKYKDVYMFGDDFRRQEQSLLEECFQNTPDTLVKQIQRLASSSRNFQAYRFLNWIENQLRNFIWEVYISKYKPNKINSKWWKGSFSDNVRDNILKNMENAIKLKIGRISYFPLDYANFDDLMCLIEKEWEFITKSTPSNISAVRGHFEYLKHMRNMVAHSRPLSHDDLMTLQEHAKRFVELIGANFLKMAEYPFYPPVSILG